MDAIEIELPDGGVLAGYWQRESYRDTATAGVILAGACAGLGLAGYLVTRYTAAETAPVMSASRGGLSIGWAGAF